MGAIATLKAVLGLDTGEYKAGMKDAQGHTVSFQRELRGATQDMQRMQKVGDGMAQVMRGNVTGGIRQVVEGLLKIPPAAAKAVVAIGQIGTAFAAGWAAGKGIDKFFGISERAGKIGDWLTPKDTGKSKGDVLREVRQGRERASGVDEETEKMRVAALKGAARIEAEYLAEKKATQTAMDNAATRDEKAAWDRRLTQLKSNFDAEIAAIKEAENEKAAAVAAAEEKKKKAHQDRVAAEKESYADQLKQVDARGKDTDWAIPGEASRGGLARVGASTGGERLLGPIHRQTQIALDNYRLNQERKRLEEEHLRRLEQIEAALSDGRPPGA
jgi:hypothetical protein